MNFISQWRNGLKCVSLTLSKMPNQIHRPKISCIQYCNSDQRRFVHISSIYFAGHSKWANIKHTKQSKDAERSRAFEKCGRLIKMAVKEGGGANLHVNSKLAQAIDYAKNISMPASTIESFIKTAEKSGVNAKEGSITLGAPGGQFICVDVLTDNLVRTKQQLIAIGKKMNFKEARVNLENIFDERGVIVTKSGNISHATALDHAIEVGAEDVIEEGEEGGILTFICAPADYMTVKRGIESLNYAIEYSGINKSPHVIASISENDAEKIKLVLTRLEEHEDVMKLHYNFEL